MTEEEFYKTRAYFRATEEFKQFASLFLSFQAMVKDRSFTDYEYDEDLPSVLSHHLELAYREMTEVYNILGNYLEKKRKKLDDIDVEGNSYAQLDENAYLNKLYRLKCFVKNSSDEMKAVVADNKQLKGIL